MDIGIGIGLTQRRQGGAFNPAALFAAAEKGVWFAPSPTTCFTDTVGGTPATVGGAAGPIILQDLSGNGKHATFANATLETEGGRHYIACNGTTTSGVTAAIDFTGSDKLTIWAGLRKASDAARSMPIELSAASFSNPGSFSIDASTDTDGSFTFGLTGSTNTGYKATTFTAPVSCVLSCRFDLAGAGRATEIFPRVNGAIPTLTGNGTTTAAGTGAFGNYALYIGRRAGASLPFNGRFYGLILRGGASSAAEIAAGEAYVNNLTGAF